MKKVCNCHGNMQQNQSSNLQQQVPSSFTVQSNSPQYQTNLENPQYIPSRTGNSSGRRSDRRRGGTRPSRFRPRQPYDDDYDEDDGEYYDDDNEGAAIDPVEPDDFQEECENNPQIEAIIEKIIQSIPPNACGGGPPRHTRQVIKVPNNYPPRVCHIRRRLPTPEPDTCERVYVCQAPKEVINVTIEKPMKPPTQYSDSRVMDPAGPPIVHSKVVCIPGETDEPGSTRPGRSGGNRPPVQPWVQPSYRPSTSRNVWPSSVPAMFQTQQPQMPQQQQQPQQQKPQSSSQKSRRY